MKYNITYAGIPVIAEIEPDKSTKKNAIKSIKFLNKDDEELFCHEALQSCDSNTKPLRTKKNFRKLWKYIIAEFV